MCAGGASRADEDQQAIVRLAAILAIAAALWRLDFEALRGRGRLVLGVGAAYLLLLLQLVPLPSGLWASLPGHDVYARIAQEAGAAGWRPFSLTPDLTLNALFALLPATAAALGALYLDARGRRRLAEGIVVTACISGVFGLAQLAAGDAAFHLYRESSSNSAVGLFANRNHQAALLACALPLTGAIAGLRLRGRGDGRVFAVIALAVATLLLLSLVATGSRMGLVLGALGILGAVWSIRAGAGPAARWSWRARLAGFSVAGAMLTGIGFAVLRGGAVQRLVLTKPIDESRVAMLKPLLATAKAFMPLGAGFGSFDSVYRRFEPNALLSTIYMNQAHNEPMQLAIEGGVPALALLALFCWWWTGAAARVVRAQASGERAMGIAAATVALILMMSSLVDYPLRTPLLGAVFAFACVQMLAPKPEARP